MGSGLVSLYMTGVVLVHCLQELANPQWGSASSVSKIQSGVVPHIKASEIQKIKDMVKTQERTHTSE